MIALELRHWLPLYVLWQTSAPCDVLMRRLNGGQDLLCIRPPVHWVPRREPHMHPLILCPTPHHSSVILCCHYSVLQMRKLQLQDVKPLTQGHPAREQASLDSLADPCASQVSVLSS